MKHIQLGTIGRPHGFRGDFVLAHRSGSMPGELETLYLGDARTAVRVENLTAMPKHLRIKLEGFSSDTDVKEKRGIAVFADRACLAPPEEGEFFVEDLVGSTVLDGDTQKPLGRLVGVEEVGPGSPDRWWVDAGKESFCFPAIDQVIEKVDTESQTIWIRDYAPYTSTTF